MAEASIRFSAQGEDERSDRCRTVPGEEAQRALGGLPPHTEVKVGEVPRHHVLSREDTGPPGRCGAEPGRLVRRARELDRTPRIRGEELEHDLEGAKTLVGDPLVTTNLGKERLDPQRTGNRLPAGARPGRKGIRGAKDLVERPSWRVR